MERQEIFNIVSKHLLTQMERSEGFDGSCVLHGQNGRKCAIGALIQDQDYHLDMENDSYISYYELSLPDEDISLLSRYLIDHNIMKNGDDSLFLSDLQFIHDHIEPINWRKRLKQFARTHKLKFREE